MGCRSNNPNRSATDACKQICPACCTSVVASSEPSTQPSRELSLVPSIETSTSVIPSTACASMDQHRWYCFVDCNSNNPNRSAADACKEECLACCTPVVASAQSPTKPSRRPSSLSSLSTVKAGDGGGAGGGGGQPFDCVDNSACAHTDHPNKTCK